MPKPKKKVHVAPQKPRAKPKKLKVFKPATPKKTTREPGERSGRRMTKLTKDGQITKLKKTVSRRQKALKELRLRSFEFRKTILHFIERNLPMADTTTITETPVTQAPPVAPATNPEPPQELAALPATTAQPAPPNPEPTAEDPTSPTFQARLQVHAARLTPLQEEKRVNEALVKALLEVEQKWQQTKARIKGEEDQMRRNMEEQQQQLTQATHDAERRLAEAYQKMKEAEERVAKMEQEEQLFSKEHERHDGELQKLIEENRQLAVKQVEITKRLLEEDL